MKISACAALLLFFFNARVWAQSGNNTLDIVSWNIEWFGSNTQGQGPPDANLQEANVKTILKALNADLYGLVEVVDTMRIRRVKDSLGSQFGLVISPFCSGNSTGTGTSWLTGQKLAFIYNKNIFSNVVARGLMRNSTNAYYNFASGRFPYMLSADVTLNGTTKSMNFILLHGKAGSTVSDYTRRRDGAQELKDTLDVYFPNSINVLMGDFNDALDTTICTGCGTTLSSFDPIIRDSVDSDHYTSLTLPLALSGQSSMTNFPNVVDNHVISNETGPLYIANSISIRHDVAGMVVFYESTTSDHFPVFSQYSLSGLPTSLPPVLASNTLHLYPNPSHGSLRLSTAQTLRGATISMFTLTGTPVFHSYFAYLAQGTHQIQGLSGLASGTYLLQITASGQKKTFKVVLLP